MLSIITGLITYIFWRMESYCLHSYNVSIETVIPLLTKNKFWVNVSLWQSQFMLKSQRAVLFKRAVFEREACSCVSDACGCVWTYRRHRRHARGAGEVRQRAAHHWSSSVINVLAVGVRVSANILKHKQQAQRALCTGMQSRLWPTGLNDEGGGLPPSVRTRELICSSSSGAPDPKIRMRRMTGWMNLKSGWLGSRRYKILTNVTLNKHP